MHINIFFPSLLLFLAFHGSASRERRRARGGAREEASTGRLAPPSADCRNMRAYIAWRTKKREQVCAVTNKWMIRTMADSHLSHLTCLDITLSNIVGGPCLDPLISPLYASSFLASSRYNFLYSAHFAKLYGSSGWSPSPEDRQPWLQIDLGRKYRIVAIATQGTFNSYDWVTKYTLLYGDRPDAWTPYVMRGGNMCNFPVTCYSLCTLPGNWNYYQVKRNVFHYAFTAKHLRFLPMGWNTEGGGKIGVRLEVYGCPYDSYVVHFEGNDMLAYSFPGGRMHTMQDHYAVNFKTLEKDGVLLHSQGLQGDLVTLELKTGRLYLHMSLGSSTVHATSGMTVLRLGNLLDTQHWHYVSIRRRGRELNFTLDSETERAVLNGEFGYLDLDKQMYVGGVIEKDMPHLPGKVNFRGCMENVFINGINVIYKTMYQEPDIRLAPKKKKMHYTCRDLLWRPMTFAGPNNYLQVPGFFRRNRLAVKFKFRSWDYTGLLLFTRFADELGSLELGLSEGQVNVTLTQPGNKRLRFAAGYRLNDGFWHTVDLAARDNLLSITIDEDESSPLKITNPFMVRTGDRYFFGAEQGVTDGAHFGSGCPKTNNTGRCVTKLARFHGCMQQIFIDDEPVDIDVMLQRKWGRYTELLLGTCGITDRIYTDLGGEERGAEGRGGEERRGEGREGRGGEESGREESRGEERGREESRGEERRAEEKRGEQRRREEKRGEQRRREESRGEERRAEESRGEERRAEEKRGEQRRREEKRGEQRGCCFTSKMNNSVGNQSNNHSGLRDCSL
ncbi:hypothetical protein P4O66_000723 [Electrophorus voltai]|uniref:Uncharacterized protein n=1 Tax=Electrophorus voltai TaxID=2609070 RepID=A0AAD8ZF89_9TELE|nr:hypothetical protein P4O66_000723 [Electrophorus voltai]